MRFVAFVAALLVFPSLAFAACEGQDWRTQLAPETMQEIRARLAHVPFQRGIAFEAVRGESRLTLFGTVHVYDQGVHVPDAIADRIRSADLVLLEATPEVMASFRQRLAEDYALSFDVSGPRLWSRLTPREWAVLVRALMARGIDAEVAERMRPWFAAAMLEQAPCDIAARAEGGMILDERVEALARDAGVAVGGLDEDAGRLLTYFSGLPEDEQLDLLRLTLASHASDGSQIVTLVRGWQDGEVALAWEVANARAAALTGDGAAVEAWYDRLHEVLVAARNRDWMRRLLELSGAVPHIVVAVGAMHLPGEDGLLRLLERRGFAIHTLILAPRDG